MIEKNVKLGTLFFLLLQSGCAGIKVVNPSDQNKNTGTLSLDATGGQLKLVGTFTCKLQSLGKRYSALGKSESEASKEVVAKCHDGTLLSDCKSENVKCIEN